MEYMVFIVCEFGYQLVSTHNELPVMNEYFQIESYDKLSGNKTIIQSCY